MAKKVDPLKAKQKRQKIIAAGGGVLLVGLLAFQVPRVMKQLNQKPPAPPVASTTTAAPTAGTPSLAAPTLKGAEQPATATATPNVSSDGVSSGDGAPVAATGQLASFSRFASKDPFAQQLDDGTSTSGGSPSSAPSSGGTTSSSSGTTSSSGGSTGGSSAPSSGGSGSVASTGGSGGSQPAPGSAVISVNGTLMTVTVGTDFPAAGADPSTPSPLFHLVSLGAHSAKISIVGGSYANGAPSVTLRENKAVTLMNTADGTKYKLILKPQGTAIPTAPSTGGTTSTSTTPSP